jgi:NAD-dependent deacetylase
MAFSESAPPKRRVASPPPTDPLTRAEQLTVAARALRAAEHICIFTGAGVSAESGIPTFRDALTGHWARFAPEELASPQGFADDPARVWQWYAERRADVRRALPNPAHTALAALAARVSHCTVITQNVDDLHERAGSRDVVRLHGSLMHARCTAGCFPNASISSRDGLNGRYRSSNKCEAVPASLHNTIRISACLNNLTI